jgi:hypothetical protein
MDFFAKASMDLICRGNFRIQAQRMKEVFVNV